MNYQLTEAQEYLNQDYKYMLTLKYQSHINRDLDKANDDLRHLRNRIHRKLFGRSPWRLLWMPSIEKGKSGRTHIHLYIGEAPGQIRKVKKGKYLTPFGNWLPYWIREEWELMNQSTKSKNEDVRSHIKILDERKSPVGYGLKTFQDKRYEQLLGALKEANDFREKQDIQKEINKYRSVDLFECLSDTFFVK